MNILVIEPDSGVADRLAGNMRNWGYEVENYGDGESALGAFQKKWFDLVLLNLNLPDMKAMTLIGHFKHQCLKVPIVAMTDRNSREMEARVRNLGILYYMVKPLDTAVLRRLLLHISKKQPQTEKISMEAYTMKKRKGPRHAEPMKQGICEACDELATCQYPKNHRRPVMFCEEFNTGYGYPQRDETRFDPVPAVTLADTVDKERFSKGYVGLCRRCERLYACRLTKPGGGTWNCEFFQERKDLQ
jgi:CheY-like chemotaxis protein